jgi:hypothetical protein
VVLMQGGTFAQVRRRCWLWASAILKTKGQSPSVLLGTLDRGRHERRWARLHVASSCLSMV